MFTSSHAPEAPHIGVSTFADVDRIVAKGVNRSDTKKEIQAQQRAWLGEVLEATGLKPSVLAKKANVSDTTLSRLLNNADYTGTLNPETVQRIKATYNVPGPEEFSGGRKAVIGLSEAARFDEQREKNDISRIVEAIVKGRSTVEPWRLKTLALESVGYLPGDILFVDRSAVPKPQDVVCAQVMDYQHGGAQTIWRVYDPPFLVGAAADRTAYKPMLVDNSRVTIAGVVRQSFRPHSLSATR